MTEQAHTVEIVDIGWLKEYEANAKKLGTIVQTTVWTDDEPSGDCPTCGGTGMCECADCAGTGTKQSPAAEPATDPATNPAEPGEMAAKVDTLTARVGESEKQLAQLTVERDGAVQRAESAEASHKTLSAERDQLAERIKVLEGDVTKANAERDEAQRKLAAFENGAPPVSSVPAEGKKRGSMWDDARKK